MGNQSQGTDHFQGGEAMRKISLFMLVGMILLLAGTVGISRAEDAEVLPKGVWTVYLENKFYFPIDERYGPSGDVEDAATDFNATLGSNVFPGLADLETALGLPPGSANIGDSVVSFEYKVDELTLLLGYGITDKLTAGVKIPYLWLKNDVSARLDTANATVGKNPLFGTPGDPFGGLAPLIPISLGGTPLTTEDTQKLLGGGLDVNGDGSIDIPGFGYKRFESWSDDGFGDIEAGLKYQYYQSDKWRLAFTGGIRFPTGEVDDPDNLVDEGFGNGAWALLFRAHNDYTGIKNLVLNATFSYDLYLPDRQTLRVPDDVDHPITANKEKVDRDLGDVVKVETSAKYQFLKGASLLLQYKYGHSFQDKVSGSKGFAYQSLEDETNWTEHVIETGLSYSTLPLYLDKKFAIPLNASLTYRNRFAGRNNVFKSEFIALAVQFYF